MRSALLHGLIAALLVAAGLAAYDHWVLRPALRIGVVDLAEVYRAKESEFTRLLTKAATDEERQGAMALARSFSQRLPAALDELPRDCRCLVVLRSALAGAPATVDLTPALRHKLERP